MSKNSIVRELLEGSEAQLIDARHGAKTLWWPKRDESAKPSRKRKPKNVLHMNARTK